MGYQDIDSEVKLEFVNQARALEILLDHKRFVCWNSVNLPREEYPFTLASSVRFTDDHWISLSSLHVLAQLVHFCRHHPGFRHKSKLFWEGLNTLIEMPGHVRLV